MITWMWPLHTGAALGAFGRFSWFLVGQSLFFLYISGMVRWLHKKGKIKHRLIDFKVSDDLKSRLKKLTLQSLLALDKWMNLLAQKALPLLSQSFVIVAKVFERGLEYYQSRPKNKG